MRTNVKAMVGKKNGLLESGLLVSFFLDNQLSQLVLPNNRGSQGENVKGINLTLKRGGGQCCVNTKTFQARNYQICDDVSDQREKTLGTGLHGCKNYVFKTTNGLN